MKCSNTNTLEERPLFSLPLPLSMTPNAASKESEETSKGARDVLPLPFVRRADASIRPLSLGSWLTFDPDEMFIYKCIFLVVY